MQRVQRVDVLVNDFLIPINQSSCAMSTFRIKRDADTLLAPDICTKLEEGLSGRKVGRFDPVLGRRVDWRRRCMYYRCSIEISGGAGRVCIYVAIGHRSVS